MERGYFPLATLVLPKKTVGTELMDSEVCENLPSSPSRGLAEHRGIGGVQRARDIIYPLVQNARMAAKNQAERIDD